MEENLNLFDVLAMLRRRWWLIAGFLAAGVLAAFLFILIVTPKFTSDATLKYNPSRFEINAQKSSVGSDLYGRLIAGELATIQSPSVLMKVLKSEQLLDDPELNRKGFWEWAGRIMGAFLSGEPDTGNHELKVLERFKAKILVRHPDRTNLINIAYESEDAGKTARVANAVATMFLSQHLEGRPAATPLAEKWLHERKESLRKRWRQSQSRVERFKADHNLGYVSGDKLREQHVDRLNQQLVLAGTKTGETRARVEQVRHLLKSRNYQQLASVVRSDVLTRFQDRLAAASQREASLSSNLLPSHPDLKKVRAEVTALQKHIENEGRRMLDNIEMEFNSAREREILMKSSFDKTIRNIQDSGDDLVKLRELERTAESGRTIYEAFLNRSNETLEQSTGNFANFHLIKRAQVPIKPSFPSKTRVLLLAMVGSLAVGIGLAFILETHCNTFRTRADVAEVLNLPLIATLPHLSIRDLNDAQVKQNPERVVSFRPGTKFGQSISALTLGLGIRGSEAPVKILAVTSAVEQEGKTIVAASLAQEAAAKGAKVLLIDGNWSRPRLRWIFRARGEKGNGRHDTSASPIIHDPVSGIDILPAMDGAGKSAGFAGSKEFTGLLRSTRNTYDLVIIDTSAVLSSPDACILAGEADATLLVVQWNKTQRETAKQALETLNNWNARTIGVALNSADLRQLKKAGQDVSARVVQKPRFVDHDDGGTRVRHGGQREPTGAFVSAEGGMSRHTTAV